MVEIISTKKAFTFRGKSVEELQNLDVREFGKYLTSREKRTIMRQFQDIEKFLNVCYNKTTKKKQIKTHKRYLIIVPKMIGMTINVHNGKAFMPVRVTGEMLGHRLGEFSLTRGRVKHGSAGVGATKGTKSKSKK